MNLLYNNLLLVSLAAGICTSIGAVLLFIKRDWSNRSLAIFLGLAAGVMTAVVIFDMLPSALIFPGREIAMLGIVAGIIILLLIERCLFARNFEGETLVTLGYLIMLGIAMHDLPEGLAIALGDELKGRTGMVIALGIGIHNIPEGMAIAAPLLMGGISRVKVFLQILLVGLITPVGTLIGQIIVMAMPGLLPFLLGMASGIMIYLVLFQLWPEAAVRGKRSRWIGFWVGMIVILLATFL